MTQPNPSEYNPDPEYLRQLVTRSGLSQRAAARAIGISERALRKYLSFADTREAPYTVQYALENLPADE